ncbi:CBS domain-containing protein [Nonomuraea maritima]|uniref:CBS domain-containing protein n=1 Tax=Nonomuraea maritima TaxID=683260 RepID=UPI00371184CB
MGRVAIAVLEEASFADIVATLKRYAVGAVTVIDVGRRPVGVVSEDDLLLKEIGPALPSASIFESRRQRREHDKVAGVRAAQLMTSPAITVTPETSVRDAARVMHGRRVAQLPVVDPVTGRIVGTLHRRDVLRIFTRPAAELAAEVEAALPDPEAISVEVAQGVVTLRGHAPRRSEVLALAETIRAIEGVVDVTCEVAAEEDEPIVVPPLL